MYLLIDKMEYYHYLDLILLNDNKTIKSMERPGKLA